MQRTEQLIDCPYCGEAMTLLLDHSEAGSEYVEDCQVCCQPMVVALSVSGDAPLAHVRREDECSGHM